ncbi:MAG: hypothetical protein B7X48_05065 [Acidiphilium sp. 34-60-192]|nr:MAG: hypothetical protein B7X48_05065 [Acidiphilium sp. 34-60-192]
MVLGYKFIKIKFYNRGFRVCINLTSSSGLNIKLEAKVKSKINFIFSDKAIICFYEILNFQKFYFILSSVNTPGFWACHQLWALNECLARHASVSARYRASRSAFEHLDDGDDGEGGIDG